VVKTAGALAPPAAVAVAMAGSAEDIWRSVLATFEEKRPRLGALLAHAEVSVLSPGSITLAVPDKLSVDQAERARAEIEAAVSTALGQPTRLAFVVGAQGRPAVLRSEVSAEGDALSADRKNRELEARQHPVIRHAQDVFNTSLKEIKT
jgi:hypothetical protein